MKKILMVDDHPVMRKFMSDHLGKKGYEVSLAADGLAALEILDTFTPDIVFIDLVMPNIGGDKLCRIIRSRPSLNHVFVVVFSAVALEGKDSFESRPADAYIAKAPLGKLAGYVDAVISAVEEERTDEIRGRIFGSEDVLERTISRELLASKKHYEMILSRMSEGLLELTDRLRVVFANPAAMDIIGLEEEMLLSADFCELIAEDRRPAISEKLKEAKRTRREVVFDSEIRFNRNLVSMKFIPATSGEDFRMLVMLKDITRQKKLERQLRQAEKMEAIGNLAGGIAHDLNNILSPVFGYTEMAMQSLPAGAPAAKNLQNVITAANRARELVHRILQFSRRSEEDIRPVKIQFVIKETLKLLHASIPATIEIRETIDPYCDAVMADAFQIQQIVMNLCTNAFHAMADDGGVLDVLLYQVDRGPFDPPSLRGNREADYVVLEVADTGCGIDSGVIDKIYDPYFTTKQMGKGTGLGLSVVHGIVEKCNGQITVDSKAGEGTIFRVYFPAVRTDAVSACENPDIAVMPRGSESIMIVDDDDVIARMYQEVLNGLGYRVSVFDNGRDACDAVMRAPEFDLIITDMTMPGKTGAELAAEVLAVHPSMPVILSTGFNERISEKKAGQIGVKKFLLKPVSIMELTRAIREVLDGCDLPEEGSDGKEPN